MRSLRSHSRDLYSALPDHVAVTISQLGGDNYLKLSLASVTRPLHAAVLDVQTASRDTHAFASLFGTGSGFESRLYRSRKTFFARSVTFRRFATDSLCEGVKAPVTNSRGRRKEMQNSKTGRQTNSQRIVRRSSLLSIALLIALSVVASPRVTAQVECLGACEEQFAACLGNLEHGSPRSSCLDTYESCVDACLGGSAAVLS